MQYKNILSIPNQMAEYRINNNYTRNNNEDDFVSINNFYEYTLPFIKINSLGIKRGDKSESLKKSKRTITGGICNYSPNTNTSINGNNRIWSYAK